MTTQKWRLTSRQIDEAVVAEDQHAAWNTLRNRPVEDFGLIVTATPSNNDDDAIPVRTAALMLTWGRDSDALDFIEAAVAQGLPDTRDGDMRYAVAHGRA